MSPANLHPSVTRLQWVGIAALAVLSLAALLHSTLSSGRTPFLPPAPGGNGEWITNPQPASTNAIVVDLERIPTVEFLRSFRVEGPAGPVTLEAHALHLRSIEINGERIALDEEGTRAYRPAALPERNWRKGVDAEVGELLKSGRNEIRVRVSHALGPALLRLSLSGPGVALATDEAWSFEANVGTARAETGQTVLARDSSLNAESLLLPTPARQLAEHGWILALVFAVCAGVYAGIDRREMPKLHEAAPWVVGSVITLLWLLIFAFKMSQLPVLMGFDIPSHLAYLDFLREHRALPLASDGWSTYHPPLFYLLTSGIVEITSVSRDGLGGRVVYRLIPFASGLANVWLAFAVARRVFRNDPLKTSLAVGAAGLLPMNIYMSAYVSNEQLHGAWVSAALLLASLAMLEPGHQIKRHAGVAVALGLAVLTKFTSLLVVPVVAFFLATKAWAVDRASPLRSGILGLGVCVGVASIGGWFYLRNWLHFGSAIVGNWDVTGRMAWWEQPGFHTATYYTRFGESLRHPFFAGYASFWDGIYSTLWGDGLVAGMVRVATRHEQWNYDFMTVAYALALPASVLMIAGFIRLLRRSLVDDDLAQRCVLSMLLAALFVVSFALLRVTITLPYYAQAKAFYAIAVVVPLAIVSAEGLAWIPERFCEPRHRALRAGYFGWLGTLACVIAMAFLG